MKKNFNNKAFTLVELLVSIFIVVLMSAIIFINYRSIGEESALQRSAYTLAQDIRKAEVMSTGAEPVGTPPVSTYGIFLSKDNPQEYIIFVDSNEDCNYDTGEEVDNSPKNFEGDVYIDTLSFGAVDSSHELNYLTITFTPPDPKISICESTYSSASAFVILKIGDKVKGLQVYTSGLIEVSPDLPNCFCEEWSDWNNLGCVGDCMSQERSRVCDPVGPEGDCTGWQITDSRCDNDRWIFGDWESLSLLCCTDPFTTGMFQRKEKRTASVSKYGCLGGCQDEPLHNEVCDLIEPPDLCSVETEDCIVECAINQVLGCSY